MKTSQNGKYKSVLATEAHKPVSSMNMFRRYDRFAMGFYLKDEVIGGGELMRVRYVAHKKKTSLQTESVSLNKEFREKGHGIHLYRHLIAHAKACGAERIYSSRNLNKYSRRMWSEKLSKLFIVVPVKRKCRECGGTCAVKPAGYYIQLKGK